MHALDNKEHKHFFKLQLYFLSQDLQASLRSYAQTFVDEEPNTAAKAHSKRL